MTDQKRNRLTSQSHLAAQWGEMMEIKTATRIPSGLYGYTKSVQATCETSIRKLHKASLRIATEAYRKDAKIAAFLEVHARRSKSGPAKVLLAALKDARPFYAKHNIAGGKTAAGGRYGLYGFRSKTATLGLNACMRLRDEAGMVSSDLHARQASLHERITGFFSSHAKAARCGFARLLSASYPDASMRLASEPKTASEIPNTVEGWLAWES